MIQGIPLTRRELVAALAVSAGVAGWIAWPRRLSAAWQDDPDVGNRAFNLSQIKSPSHRALPASESELIEAFADVQSRSLAFRVQSSGHCFAGLSQTDQALLDLRLMNAITVDAEAQTVTAGPGTSLGQINGATAPTGLALSAGYCQTVALGGHVSGGGVGILSRRFGLASDQLIEARILTADGQVQVANDAQDPDLIWALRGGGAASFGIVTQYKLLLREPGPMTFMDVHFRIPPPDAPDWLTAWQVMTLQADPRLSFQIYLDVRPDGRLGVRAMIFSALPEPESEAEFNALVALGHMAGQPSVRFGTFHQIADWIWPRDHYGERATKAGSDFLATALDEAVWQTVVGAMADGREHRLGMIIEALGGAIDDLDNTLTAYVHRGTAKFKVQYTVALPEAGDRMPAEAAHDRLIAALRPSCTGGAFYNYPEVDRPNWGQAYFGENFERLKQIKRRYDPDNVFSHPLSIPVE